MRAALLAALALAGCAPQPAQREASVLPTVVSLNPCTDAVLAEIAAPGQMLAISHYSHDPRATSMDIRTAHRFAATGGTVEEVLALDPDIVVAGSFLPPATRAAFDDLGIRVETFGIAATVEESADQVERLADAVGRPAAGKALAARIARAAEPVAAAKPVSTVLWQPGGIVPGEGALVSDLLRRAGFVSHSAARGYGQADHLSLEQVLADPPELLLVAGDTPAQRHPALRELDRTRAERFDPALLYCGGPTIERAMGRLREIRTSLSPLKGRDLGPQAERQTARGPRLRGGSVL